MSQSDYNIENADGATVRADINSQLAAIGSTNSGPTAPSVTFPYMRWHDTANAQLKERNSANTAWIVVADIVSGELVPHAAGESADSRYARLSSNNTFTSGNEFSLMPTVAGDPVVESGSNSDGEWTRWADGTQICRNNYTTGFQPPSTTYKREFWSYPVTFIDNLVDTVAVAGESTTEHNTDRFVNINTGERESGTGTKIKAYTSGSVNLGFGVLIVAHGRWK